MREYSTKEEMLPSDTPPAMYISAPNRLTMASDKLLTKFTDGPVMEPNASAL